MYGSTVFITFSTALLGLSLQRKTTKITSDGQNTTVANQKLLTERMAAIVTSRTNNTAKVIGFILPPLLRTFTPQPFSYSPGTDEEYIKESQKRQRQAKHHLNYIREPFE